MKEHTSEFKTQLKELGRQIRSQVIYGNTVLEEELFGVTPHYNGSILKSTMKQLDIETSVNIPLMTEVEYKLGLLVNNNWEWLSFGKYYVYTTEKMEDKDHYKLVCYDKLLYSMIPYVGVIGDFPMTLRDYLGEICTILNITFASNGDEFCNYNRELPSDRYVGLSDYTYRDVLDEIAQATGSMICLNSDDELVVRYINEGEENYNTIEGTNLVITDVDTTKQASIIEIQGSGTKRKLPKEFQEVEYIESTGTQWIDTGLIGNFTESLTVKSKFVLVEQTTSGEQALLGNKNSSNNGCTVFFSANSRNIKSWSGSGTTWTPASLTLGQITTFEHTWTVPKGRTANINGTSYSNTTIANNQTSNNTSFAILNDKPSATLAPAHIKLYYIEFYIDNILQRQLMPCYNIYTNVIGMYDTVYGTFYSNKGTGTFGKGTDIVYNNVTGDNQIIVSNKNLLSSNLNDYIITGTYGYTQVTDKEEKLWLSLRDKDTTVDISGIYFGFSWTGYNASGGVKWAVSNGTIYNTGLSNEFTGGYHKYISFYPKNETTFNKIFERFYIQVEKRKLSYRLYRTSKQ